MASIKTLFVLFFAALAALVAAEENKNMLRGVSSEEGRELFFLKKSAKVYNKSYWKGDYLDLDVGFYDWGYLQPKHFDDRIESIYLPWFYKAKMCSDPGLRGHCQTFKFSHGYVKVGDGVSSIEISKWW